MAYALSKERLWPAVKYRPNPGQRQVHKSTVRNKVNIAGRRAGKSRMGGMELVPEALITYTLAKELKEANKRREFWIVGPEYSDSEKEFRVLWNTLMSLGCPLDKPGSYNAPWTGEMMISLWDGTFMCTAKSAKYPGTLVGEGLSGVIFAEAAKLKPIVYHKYIRPTLADYRGWTLFNSTPEGKNWLYELWQRGQDPNDIEWSSWRMPSWINNFVYKLGIDDPEIISLRRDMSTERFNQEIAALFTDFVGGVFKTFDEETHVTDIPFDRNRVTYLAVDYGWTNPFVALLIQVDVWDTVYVVGEYRCTQTDITDIAQTLKTWMGGIATKAKYLYPDPASPGDTAVLTRELRVPANTSTGGDLKWRLELIRQRLKPMPEHIPWEQRKPRLYIDRSCVEMIREMQDYRYPEFMTEHNGEGPEMPEKKNDHAPEALGRFMRGYFGPPTGATGKAVVRRAMISA